MQIRYFPHIYRKFYQNHSRKMFYDLRNLYSILNFICYNKLFCPHSLFPVNFLKFKNTMKIRYFWTILRIICPNHGRRIFYGTRNFEIWIFWTILNLATIYDFPIALFAIDIFTFKDG